MLKNEKKKYINEINSFKEIKDKFLNNLLYNQ